MGPSNSRTCVGCGTVQHKKNMLRLVLNPEGKLIPDEKNRMEGRGAYICPDRECLDKAVKKRGFNKAFKCSVTLEDLKEVMELIDKR
jgi:predicted RNA-binding protein YlxR (DUF448 family)